MPCYFNNKSCSNDYRLNVNLYDNVVLSFTDSKMYIIRLPFTALVPLVNYHHRY